MKQIRRLVLFLTMAGTSFVSAQMNFVLKSSKALVNGTSSLHDWESSVSQVTCTGLFSIKGSSLHSIQNVLIKIPVTGIKSSEGKTMDNKTYKAFKSNKNPFIIYTLTSPQINEDQQEATIEATGNLIMAGFSQPVALTVKSKLFPSGDLQLSVTQKNKNDFIQDETSDCNIRHH